MASKTFQHVFRYNSFTIDKDQLLGHGSYGAVYKAMCDQLPCAAKILHQTILDPKDKGSEKVMQRFQQECTFLENIRHPHIVQYLGMTTDPESRLPILLMELLDENLTGLLERSQQSLAYCSQVDICHDIALAVAYLHSNDIIHRDLSSNNVLIIAGQRAKVTDFGMSKLAGATPTKAPLTMCPGTLGYMPPEALREPPRYTKKLDCFSEGVIMIQVCTQLLPEPGPRSRFVQDARSPTGTIEIPVLEPERRKEHIDSIDPNHPLLPIAIECLEYQDSERPPSEEICLMLSDLKGSSDYQENLRQVQTEVGLPGQEGKLKAKEEINMPTIQQQQEIRAKNVQLQEKDKLFQKKESQFQRELATRERRIQQINHQLEEQQKVIAKLQQCNHSLQQQVKQLEDRLNQQKRQAVRSSQPQPLLPPVRHPAQIMKQGHGEEHVYCSLIKAEPEQISPAPPLPQPRHKPRSPSGTYDRVESLGIPSLPPQRLPHLEPHRKPHPPPSVNKKITLEWRDGGKAPIIMERGGAVSNGNIVYFVSTRGESCSFNMITGKWNDLPKCPHGYSSLAIVYGHLTAIGGCTFDKFEPQNKLVSRLGDRGWVDYFPAMPTKRWKSAAVSTEQYLVVAGGKQETSLTLNTVEVMNIQNVEWSTVASLPHPYSEASAAICGDIIYMMGGFDDTGKTKSVLTCSLTELLQRRKRSTSVWGRVVDVPTTRSTCAAVSGHLLAIGGMDAHNRKASAIYEYNTTTGSWDLISNMPTPQYNRLVAVLPTNEMIVVGGCTRFKTDTVDIAKANITM